MPATSPRITTVVDEELTTWLQQCAKAEERSASTLVRKILARIYAKEEERYWTSQGEARLATFDEQQTIAHEDAWKWDRPA